MRELDAWLYFLGSDDPKNIQRVIQKYPFFQELYKDIIRFRYQPKEVIRMYSEALAIMDKNTVEYMIDELRSEIRQKDLSLQQKDRSIQEKDRSIQQKNRSIQEKDRSIQQKDQEIMLQANELRQKEALIRELQNRLLQFEKK